MHKFTLALLVGVAIVFISASAHAAQASVVKAPADQGGGITPGVGLDGTEVPPGGRKSKSRKILP